MLFWELYHSGLPAARLALTLHNMDSQGECSQEEFQFTGVCCPMCDAAHCQLQPRHGVARPFADTRCCWGFSIFFRGQLGSPDIVLDACTTRHSLTRLVGTTIETASLLEGCLAANCES